MEELLPRLESYGLPGLIVALIALYVWRVKIPADQKAAEARDVTEKQHDSFIQALITDGERRSQALISAFREDLAKRDDKLATVLRDVEASHRDGLREITAALQAWAPAPPRPRLGPRGDVTETGIAG